MRFVHNPNAPLLLADPAKVERLFDRAKFVRGHITRVQLFHVPRFRERGCDQPGNGRFARARLSANPVVVPTQLAARLKTAEHCDGLALPDYLIPCAGPILLSKLHLKTLSKRVENPVKT